MEPNCLNVSLRTRQLNWQGNFIWGNTDPDDLMLELLAELLAEKPDAAIVRIYCPGLDSDPSDYSYSWYLKYRDLTFEFVGPAAAHFENAAKAARARFGEWF